MAAKLAARVGDVDALGSPIAAGSPNTFVEGSPQARVGDPLGPICNGTLTSGSPTVLVNGQPAVRITDPTACSHAVVTVTTTKTLIGEGKPKGEKLRGCILTAAKNGNATVAF